MLRKYNQAMADTAVSTASSIDQVEEAQRVTKLLANREEEARQLKQQLLQVTTENDALTFKLQVASSLAERRLSEIEELQTTAREKNRLLVDAQRQEMQAQVRAAKQETQVALMTHALTRAQKEAEAAQQDSQWLEEQLAEKTKTVQELRHEMAKRSHDLEELKIRSEEELTSAKRQMECPTASARVTELQSRCDALHKSLSDSEQALALEPERTKAQVEHLFREQAEASEARIQALQDDVQRAEERIKDMEAKKIFSLQTASAVADLSPSAGEAHLAAHGLTLKQMYDHILELEETLQAERTEKDKLLLYMDRINKEVQKKAPVWMGLRLDLERTTASHTQVSERLERYMQELAKTKRKEQEAFKEKKTLEKKCEALCQSVEDLSKQVQHLLFRSHDTRGQPNSLDVGSDNLVVFKDVEELQVRNQQLLAVIRELKEMNKAMTSDNVNDSLEVDAANSSGSQESAALMKKRSSRHGSVDVDIESKKDREVQMEFYNCKMEKQANVKLLQEALKQERSKCSEL
ncbi:hypothetical protein PsorP6_010014 [Peronosclerospora sorghi]|uniref:Uncharacterized protein n=1 Tax=Peronosclerospora sorghi TaxID=230839 RepID=A0ACC0VUU1_9STRA|nr:hypothetical protein PsorP6_010014 [Peronosclerospora sorghi]